MLNLKRIKFIFTFILLCLVKSVFAASEPPWPTAPQTSSTITNPFFYYFDNDTVRTALIKVAQSFEIKIHFSTDISDDILNQKLSGHFKVYSPTELFNRFSSNFGFTWFYYDGMLYITTKNFITKNFFVAPELLRDFKRVLSNDGLLDARFGWSEVPSEGMIVITGPEDYINLITKRTQKLNISPMNHQFAIFHLKYANAVDTTVSLNNSQIVIPGVATILRTLLQGNQDVNSNVDSKLLKQVIEPLKNNMKSTIISEANSLLGKTQEAPPSSSSSDNSNSPVDTSSTAPNLDSQQQKGTISTAVIQADQRLNTIIIRDKSSNIPIYQSLINLLDVPAPLIQVEVLIMDIDQLKMNSAGIDWWGSNGKLSGGYGANNLKSNAGPGASALTTSFGNVSPGNLIVTNIAGFMSGLRFLQDSGYAKAESKSAVITIDNIAAIVNLTESFYTTNAQTQQSQQVQANMQMQVTPHLIYDEENKRIRMTVSLQDGSVQERTINGMPSTLQGNLNSQAIVEEGNSLLLAGFSHKRKENVESKVPLLGDIPIVGWLFKNSSAINRELQRSYLVTPKIIWADKNEKVPNFTILNKKMSQTQDNTSKE